MTSAATVLRTEPWPQVTGIPGVTQGGYGEHGNLEVVACDAERGLWVGWFNTDDTDAHSGARVGCWSGALRFGGPHRYRSATITQVQAGPDFLEVLALTDAGDLRRQVWSPSQGFVDHGVVADKVEAHSGVVELADGRLVALVSGEGRARLLSATPGAAYPGLNWGQAHVPTGIAADQPLRDLDACGHGDHLDIAVVHADGLLRLVCDGEDVRVEGGVHAARAARAGDAWAIAAIGLDGTCRLLTSGRAQVLGPADGVGLGASDLPTGRRWEVLRRRGGALRHERIAVGGARSSSRPLSATVWTSIETTTVHRS